MYLQHNPYLLWQLIPFLILFGLGAYITRRARSRSVTGNLSMILLASAFWSLTGAIQLASPDHGWQLAWHSLSHIGILILPTAWFLLAVRFTGIWYRRLQPLVGWFALFPALTFLALLTNFLHGWFYTSTPLNTVDSFSILSPQPGPLFLLHLVYSYSLILLGIAVLVIFLFSNFRRFGTPAYALLIGILAPLAGSLAYHRGLLPPTFPDPTPITFTITGLAFAWAVFAGRMLDAVPIAHEFIINHLSNGVIVVDKEGLLIDINTAAQEMLGLPRGRALKLPAAQFLRNDPKAAAVISDLLSPASSTAPTRQCLYRPHGRQLVLRLTLNPLTDNYNQPAGHLLQLEDITRQEQAEQNLLDARETMSDIIDTLHEYYFETDVHGYILNINKAFSRHLGYEDKQEIIGKHFRHFTDRQSVRDVFHNFERVFSSGETVELFQYNYRTRDGQLHIGETTLVPIFQQTKVVAARGILRDITDRVEAQEQLRQAKADVDRRLDQLSSLNHLAVAVSASLDLESVLASLTVELTRIFPVRNAWIATFTPSCEELEVVAFHTTDPGEPNGLGVRLSFEGNAAFQMVVNDKRSLVISDAQRDPRTRSSADIFRQRGTHALLLVPLLMRGEAIGIIGMPAHQPDYIFQPAEITLAETIASQVAIAIDHASLFTRTSRKLDEAEQDLEIGSQIQAGFFPHFLPALPGWEFAAHFQPARQVAGDFYDIFQPTGSNLVVLIIGDVCDKGVGAALFMVLFRSLLRAFCQSELHEGGDINQQLARIAAHTNDYIATTHEQETMFATIFLGVLETTSGDFHYINAGHEPPALLDRDGHLIRRLPPTGPAMGVLPGAVQDVQHIDFNHGDFLVGYTDGTTDALDEHDQPFTSEHLLKTIQVPWTSLFSMSFELRQEIDHHVNGRAQFDDITLIAMRRMLTPQAYRHAICRPSQTGYLPAVLDFISGAARESGLSTEEGESFRQAAHAALEDIFSTRPASDPGVFSIFFESEGGCSHLTLRHDGDPLPQPPTMHGFTRSDYTPIEGGNQLLIEMSHSIPELQPN